MFQRPCRIVLLPSYFFLPPPQWISMTVVTLIWQGPWGNTWPCFREPNHTQLPHWPEATPPHTRLPWKGKLRFRNRVVVNRKGSSVVIKWLGVDCRESANRALAIGALVIRQFSRLWNAFTCRVFETSKSVPTKTLLLKHYCRRQGIAFLRDLKFHTCTPDR